LSVGGGVLGRGRRVIWRRCSVGGSGGGVRVRGVGHLVHKRIVEGRDGRVTLTMRENTNTIYVIRILHTLIVVTAKLLLEGGCLSVRRGRGGSRDSGNLGSICSSTGSSSISSIS